MPKVAGGEGEGPSRLPAPHIPPGPQQPWRVRQVVAAQAQCALENELLGVVLFNFLNIVFEIYLKK